MKKHNPKDHIYSVYALECPIENKVKYVGQTEDLRKRFLGHIQSPGPSTKSWIKMVLKKKMLPKMIELERADLYKINEREKYWINHYQQSDGGLLNRSVGFQKKSARELPIAYLPENITPTTLK